MSLYSTPVRPFFEHGLIEELYYIEKRKFMICTLAGWKLIVVCTDSNVVEKVGGYAGLFVDQAYIEGVFAGENRENHILGEFYFNDESMKEMVSVKEKIDSGEMNPLYDMEFVKELKKKYIEQHRDITEKYGNPPAFSEKKVKTAVILTFVLGGIGGQFFYIGKYILGLLCAAISVFSCATMIFAPMMIMGMITIYGSLFFLLMGKIKDRNGRYITTVKNQERIRHIVNTMEKYREEIGK